MADYLTAKAVFTCNQGGTIRCGDDKNKSVTHDGAELLTTGATVKSKSGICQTLLEAQIKPPNCKCQLTAWLTGFSPMKTSNGKPLLKDSATNFCPFGGTISVKTSGVAKKITTGAAPSAMTQATATLVKVAASAQKTSTEKSSTEKFSVEKSSTEKSLTEKSSAEKTSVEKASTEKTSVDAVAEKPSIQVVDENVFKCPVCNRRKNCEYFMEGAAEKYSLPPVTRRKNLDAAQKVSNADLRKNYFQYLEDTAGLAEVRKNLSTTWDDKTGDLDFYRRLIATIESKSNAADRNFLESVYRQLEIIQTEKRIPWGYEAHHLIPIDEVFAKCPKSVLVANLGKFDSADMTRRVFNINGAENCIMLLSYNRDKKFETFFDRLQKNFVKRFQKFFGTAEENATYELMKVVESEHKFKIQWHVGQHTYKFKKAESVELAAVLQKKVSPPILRVYEDVVYDRMLDVEDEIDLKKICPRRFREKILTLVADIRDHLAAFAHDPCASYPFFVTKSNWYYALGVD